MRTGKTDQTGWMLRLIRVFGGGTDHIVGFVLRRLNYRWYTEICKTDRQIDLHEMISILETFHKILFQYPFYIMLLKAD